MSEFYDWAKTLSYNAPLTIVVGARGIGKTYGLRLQCVRDYLRDGSRFVEVFRYKNEMKNAAADFFGRLSTREDLQEYEFRSTTRGAFIRPAGAKKWEQIGYYVPLSRYQEAKQNTYTNVRRVFLDEFIIDRDNRYGRYLPSEFAKFANVIDTVTRQRAGDGTAPSAYLLGNALDLVNPYFAALGITEQPRTGYTWHANKTVLLHFAEVDTQASEAKRMHTLAGRLLDLAGDEAEQAAANENTFTVKGSTFIDRKPRLLIPLVAVIWKGQPLTVWIKDEAGLPKYHVRKGIAPELEQIGKVWYFSRADARIDYKAAKRGEKALAFLAPAFQQGRITAATPAAFEALVEMLKYFSLAI